MTNRPIGQVLYYPYSHNIYLVTEYNVCNKTYNLLILDSDYEYGNLIGKIISCPEFQNNPWGCKEI